MDRSIAGDHEVLEDTDQKLQVAVRLGLKWASSFGNAASRPEKTLQQLLSQLPRSKTMAPHSSTFALNIS